MAKKTTPKPAAAAVAGDEPVAVAEIKTTVRKDGLVTRPDCVAADLGSAACECPYCAAQRREQ